jgi:hypothetical protein
MYEIFVPASGFAVKCFEDDLVGMAFRVVKKSSETELKFCRASAVKDAPYLERKLYPLPLPSMETPRRRA